MEPWEQQKGERSKAFMLFCIYRDLGPLRSLEKCSIKYHEDHNDNLNIRQFGEYSRKYDWVARAAAYDQHLDELERAQLEEELKEMTKRHARDTARIQEIAMNVLAHPDMQHPEDMEPSKIAWIVQTVSNAYEKAGGFERLTRGESTEKISNEVDARIEASLEHNISVFDKLKKAKKLIEEEDE